MPNEVELKVTLDDTVRRVGDLEDGYRELRRHVALLDSSVAEIKQLLNHTATKADLSDMARDLSTKIDTSVNGILRDALNAVPGKQASIWATVSSIVLIISLVVTIVVAFHRPG